MADASEKHRTGKTTTESVSVEMAKPGRICIIKVLVSSGARSKPLTILFNSKGWKGLTDWKKNKNKDPLLRCDGIRKKTEKRLEKHLDYSPQL